MIDRSGSESTKSYSSCGKWDISYKVSLDFFNFSPEDR